MSTKNLGAFRFEIVCRHSCFRGLCLCFVNRQTVDVLMTRQKGLLRGTGGFAGDERREAKGRFVYIVTIKGQREPLWGAARQKR